MMVRKAHTKSRKGCLNCKRRHVKCDETKPHCSPCTRLEIDCQWPEIRGTPYTVRTSSPAQSPGYGLDTNAPSTPAGSSSPHELGIADLKLLHFWTMNTALTCTARNTTHIYQTVYVELGFQFPWLLRGLLAVAAIHKAVVRPAERKELLLQSSEHYDVAISSYLEIMHHADPATCAPVFALSGILHMHNLGMAQVTPPDDAVTAICSWIQMVRGVRASIEPNWFRLIVSEVAPVLTGVNREGVDPTVRTEVVQLEELVAKQKDLNLATKETYLQAIEELNLIFLNVRRSLETKEQYTIAMTMSWLATVNQEFVDLLFARDQLALVMMGFFAVLFKVQDHTWWMRGWSKWTLDCVERELSPELRKWLDWPRSQIYPSS
ncbi:Putative zn(2)-C6 fungal-type DNA-binding domain-containing protein [Septoria linicola]|uniref:Zn(2)-C6 fungal-type DNA-binding domain-containing protein n=1 Tax=Septoria linicola TaxID=215465 RepID=A0A9Q9ASH5_9PEZI|nr:putative zn(2)-C6 fungal-type DNA-binding domain-containing protein [Septoria linicola]USW52388.1 Putative zn(2)-C6 fungal-type DNA-binding domain-containing protein [Septoria linicola]